MRLLLLVVCGWLIAPLAHAQISTPATLLITGNIVAGGGISPAIGDTVIIFNPAIQRVEERGRVVSRQGLFSVTMTRTSAFVGTELTLLFQKTGVRYQLYEDGAPSDGGTPADFVFQGGLVPRRASITATVGEQVGVEQGAGDGDGDDADGDGTGGDNGDGGQPTTPGNDGGGATEEPTSGSPFDINDDGVVDQVDIDLVKDVVAGRPVSSTIELRADVNRDEIVNTRDIIGVIKAANREERARRKERAQANVRRL